MELTTVIEAILFASEKPLSPRRIHNILKEAAITTPSDENAAFAALNEQQIRDVIGSLEEWQSSNRSGLMVQEVAEGFQLRTRPEMVTWVRELFDTPKVNRLTQPGLETLSVIAYRQPLSRSEIEAVRGVAVDGVIASLLEKKLIHIAGRSTAPGRPLLYETTPEFLQEFGLKSLDELPNADELRRLKLETPVEPVESTETGTPETLPAEPAHPELPLTEAESVDVDASTEGTIVESSADEEEKQSDPVEQA